MARRLGVGLVLLLALLPVPAATAAPPPNEWDLRTVHGRFYRQTSSVAGAGYIVSNRAGIAFWDVYGRLGPEVLGYPLSQRFDWDGRTTQVFQRAVLQHDPATDAVAFVNTIDLLGQQGHSPWLHAAHSIPYRADPSALPAGATFDETVRAHLALLNDEPKLREYYHSVPDALAVFGLPTSRVEDFGTLRAIRTQRGALQLWLTDTPWAQAGDVTAVLAGSLAAQAGLFPDGEHWRPVEAPEGPPPVPNLNDQARMGPASVIIPPGNRWVDVDLTKQKIYAYVDDQAIFWAPVTTGKAGWETPVGRHRIFHRVFDETMDSATLAIPRDAAEGYYLKHVYYTQYFAPGGIALHSNYWQPVAVFGAQPTSHGCVGLLQADAAFFWKFATEGTEVVVHY